MLSKLQSWSQFSRNQFWIHLIWNHGDRSRTLVSLWKLLNVLQFNVLTVTWIVANVSVSLQTMPFNRDDGRCCIQWHCSNCWWWTSLCSGPFRPECRIRHSRPWNTDQSTPKTFCYWWRSSRLVPVVLVRTIPDVSCGQGICIHRTALWCTSRVYHRTVTVHSIHRRHPGGHYADLSSLYGRHTGDC